MLVLADMQEPSVLLSTSITQNGSVSPSSIPRQLADATLLSVNFTVPSNAPMQLPVLVVVEAEGCARESNNASAPSHSCLRVPFSFVPIDGLAPGNSAPTSFAGNGSMPAGNGVYAGYASVSMYNGIPFWSSMDFYYRQASFERPFKSLAVSNPASPSVPGLAALAARPVSCDPVVWSESGNETCAFNVAAFVWSPGTVTFRLRAFDASGKYADASTTLQVSRLHSESSNGALRIGYTACVTWCNCLSIYMLSNKRAAVNVAACVCQG